MSTTQDRRDRGTAGRASAAVVLGITGVVATWLVIGSALAAPRPPVSPAPATTTTTVIDTTAPPAPSLTDRPGNPTTNKNAHFKLSSVESGVSFSCSLDGTAYGPCAPTVNYNGLDFAEHCFSAKAVDAAGNASPATTWCWSIVLQGGFPVSGRVEQRFFPGATRSLNLVIGNPYNFPIRVTAVAITVDATTGQPGCDGPTNLSVTQGLAVPVDVPRNSTHSLLELGVDADDWPRLTMPNLPVNQDACKNATFSLAFTGQAVKP